MNRQPDVRPLADPATIRLQIQPSRLDGRDTVLTEKLHGGSTNGLAITRSRGFQIVTRFSRSEVFSRTDPFMAPCAWAPCARTEEYLLPSGIDEPAVKEGLK